MSQNSEEGIKNKSDASPDSKMCYGVEKLTNVISSSAKLSESFSCSGTVQASHFPEPSDLKTRGKQKNQSLNLFVVKTYSAGTSVLFIAFHISDF